MAKVLLLSDDAALRGFLEACGDSIVEEQGDWLVSFGYRAMVRPDILKQYGDHAVNLHIGALPWNRGAHPNFWAWKDGTPHGVTLHVMTEKLDSGPMIAQRRVTFGPGFTLKTSWLRLQAEARALFMEFWPELRRGDRGSYHRSFDLPEGTDWGAAV